MSAPDTIRAEVRFSGRVQGVGFRATVQELASRSAAVNGWVRNEADGSVFMIAEGPRAAVDTLIEAISRRMARFVRSVQRDDTTPQGEAGFEIRR